MALSALILASANVGCTRDGVADLPEYVLPGAPLAPKEAVGGDWFKRGDEAAVSTESSVSAVISDAGTLAVARYSGGKLIEPVRIIVQSRELVTPERAYDGYTFKYPDRIELVVSPSAEPLDLNASLSRMDATTTAGQSRLWRPITLPGDRHGAVRSSATQRWQSGVENRMPAVIEWSQHGSGDIPYVRYALLGDSLDDVMGVFEQFAIPDD